MRIRQWDPAEAPDREIEAWLRAMNAALAADLGDEPAWRSDRLRDYLSVTMPGQQRVAWLAEDRGEIIGYCGSTLLGYDSPGTACLELFADPTHRRRGAGTALLDAAIRHAADHDQDVLTAEVVEGGPAADFYAALGFQHSVAEDSSILQLAGLDTDRLTGTAGRVGAGYHIEHFTSGPPDALLASYADAKLIIRHTPVADVEWHVGFEAQRLRESLDTLRARGLRPYVAVAVHTASGEVAGLTELVVPAHRPTRADQYDTIVVPEHRGYGLGLAMKARMLLDLRIAEPQVATVQTWQGVSDEPMLRVNAVLGFHPTHRWYEYEAAVTDLAHQRRIA